MLIYNYFFLRRIFPISFINEFGFFQIKRFPRKLVSGDQMEVYIEKTKSSVNYEKACKASELLASLDINPATVLIVKNGEAVLPDEDLSETDEIKLLSVVSGG